MGISRCGHFAVIVSVTTKLYAQPAMEREWMTDPFEVSAIDGYFYGRGTSDNKVRALFEVDAKGLWVLPLTLT